LTRSRSAKIAGVLLSTILALAAPHAQESAFDTVSRGCYRLLLSEWSYPFQSGMPSLHVPPEFVRFDTAEVSFPRTRSPVRYWIHPNIPAIEASRRPWDPAWMLSSPDSVRVNWTTGFAGVQLDLAVRGDSLFGLATARYDVAGLPIPWAKVVGGRIECPPHLER
jgi:hypothetical protein